MPVSDLSTKGHEGPRKVVWVRPDLSIPRTEIRLSFSRSGGPGGQHVNKVETSVLLRFDVGRSPSFNDAQRKLMISRLRSRIGKDGILQLTESGSRSQWKNRERVIERFAALLSDALKPRKKRIRTTPNQPSKESRLRVKTIRAKKKAWRRRPQTDGD